MLKRTGILLLVLVFSLGMIVSGCGGDGEAVGEDLFVVGSGDVGGTFYPVASTIANIANDNVDNIRLTVESTGGSVDNARMVGTGELDFGMTMGNLAFQAYEASGPFEGQEPATNIGALFATYPSVAQFIALADSGFVEVKDLEGTRIAAGMPGSGSEDTTRGVLEAAGFAYGEDVQPEFLGVGEGADALRDGHVDAAQAIGGLPFGAYLDLSETRDMVVLAIDDETADILIAKEPWYYKTVVPAGTYRGQDEDVPSLAVKCLFIANTETVSDELAYEIVKAVWENMDRMFDGHASLRAMTEDFVAKDLPIPLHPGAQRFWEEQGLTD